MSSSYFTHLDPVILKLGLLKPLDGLIVHFILRLTFFYLLHCHVPSFYKHIYCK